MLQILQRNIAYACNYGVNQIRNLLSNQQNMEDEKYADEADELCTICYTSELSSEPCTKLSCGHTFHTDCVVQLLTHRWTTLRISFAFMSCPSCKQEIKMSKSTPRPVAKELGPLLSLKKKFEKEALINAER